jgi:hypothetical protein
LASVSEAPRQTLRLLLFAAVITCGATVQAAGPGTTSRNDFDIEAEAAHHCSGRPVVWVFPASHLYYAKSDPEYGRGGRGAYMCEDEARGDGNRRARDGVQAPR